MAKIKSTRGLLPKERKMIPVILSFKVIIPEEYEIAGEILSLSMFGEYCPDRSLRGYTLEHLLKNPTRYRPQKIVDQAEVKTIKGIKF